MTCQDVIDFLMDYEDGALTPTERERFNAHLSVCPPCTRYLDSYRKTIALGKGAMRDKEPGDIPQELIRAVLSSRDSAKGDREGAKEREESSGKT